MVDRHLYTLLSIIKNNAQHQLESDEISLQQYLIQLSNCSEIQLNYLKKIYEYNCMAIQLEKYHE